MKSLFSRACPWDGGSTQFSDPILRILDESVTRTNDPMIARASATALLIG